MTTGRSWFIGGGASGAPGQITDLATPTSTGTSFLANFSTPTGTITGYEYRINGGTATSLGGGSGTAITNQVTGLAVNVEVRAVGPGGAGPWSNVSVGDPGINLQIRFDNNDPIYGTGETNGSWQDQPTGVTTTSGPIDYPHIGFPSTAGYNSAAATAAMLQWGRHLRCFINSKSTVSVWFGMARTRRTGSSTTYGWVEYPTNTNGIASNLWSQFATSIYDLSYAEYRTLVSQLPSAEQRALYPDPGTTPWSGNVVRIPLWLKACIEGGDFPYSSGTLSICFHAGWNWDWQLDTTVCEGGRSKANAIAWHEFQQSNCFIEGFTWAQWQVFKSAGNNWLHGDPNSPCYMSIDGGVTNISNVDGGSLNEKFDLANYPSARSSTSPALGNANVPGFGGNPGTAMQCPSGIANPYLPFRATEDAKQWFMLFPASPWLKSQAGF